MNDIEKRNGFKLNYDNYETINASELKPIVSHGILEG